MSHDDAKQALYARFHAWLDKPAAYPLADGDEPDDEEPVWLFRWEDVPEPDRAEMLSSIFNDCEPEDYTDICEITPTETPHGTVHDRALKADWLPFGLAMVDLEGAAEWAGDGHAEDFPQFSELLLVNLNELAGDDTPVYRLEVDGTAIPKPAVERYRLTLGEIELNEPVSQG